MTTVFRIASLVFNQPLLVDPTAAITLASGLAERFGVEPLAEIDASRFVGKPAGPRGEDGRTINMYREQDGVALISVLGELVNRGAWIGASSGLTSYEGLDAQLAAAEDPRIRAVILDMNTPGGSASGAMETAARVRALAAKKPVYAFVNGQAASAGYAIASGATRIVTTPSGVLGSIGVVWMHLDRSAQVEKSGVKPTLLTAGAYKADGHPLSALPDDARARIQGQIDQIYSLFVSTVAAHRPMTEDAVRKTEAGVFMGQAAVAAGVADAVGTLDDVFAMIRADLSAARTTVNRGLPMTAENQITQATLDSAVATARTEAHAAGRSEGLSAGRSEGLAAERARISAILGHASAKGREPQAQHMAFKTGMSPEDAAAILEAAPATAAAPASPLAAAMAALGQTNLGPGGELAAGVQPKSIDAAAIYARRAGK
jgi:signal peptide peptidase SppA